MVVRTEVNISFRIPKYAVDFLEKMRSQSSSIYFEIDSKNQKLTLYDELLDFKWYTNDCDNLADFENMEGVE